MPFCNNCGSELTSEDVYCGNCGTKRIVEETDPLISREITLNEVQSRKEFDLRTHVDNLIEDGMWISIDQQGGSSAVTEEKFFGIQKSISIIFFRAY